MSFNLEIDIVSLVNRCTNVLEERDSGAAVVQVSKPV